MILFFFISSSRLVRSRHYPHLGTKVFTWHPDTTAFGASSSAAKTMIRRYDDTTIRARRPRRSRGDKATTTTTTTVPRNQAFNRNYGIDRLCRSKEVQVLFLQSDDKDAGISSLHAYHLFLHLYFDIGRYFPTTKKYKTIRIRYHRFHRKLSSSLTFATSRSFYAANFALPA